MAGMRQLVFILCVQILCIQGEYISDDNVFTKVSYKDDSISVWKVNDTFFTLPLAYLTKESISYKSTGQKKLNFEIVLMNDDFKRNSVNHLRTLTGECIQLKQIQIVPAKEIDVTVKSRPESLFQLNKRWNMSMNANPEELKMAIPCQTDMNVCQLYKRMLENDPLLRISFIVSGNTFELPVKMVENQSTKNQSDATVIELVKCKTKEEIERENMLKSIESMNEKLDLLNKQFQNIALINKQLKNLAEENNYHLKILRGKGFKNSIIVTDNTIKARLMNMIEEVTPEGAFWEKCFTASKHDFSSQMFHRLCDFRGPTLTILQVGSYISGGYTEKSWNTSKGNRNDRSDQAFLFSLNKNIKLPAKKGQSNAINSYTSYGPSFGSDDLGIRDKCDENTNSRQRFLGEQFILPTGYSVRDVKTMSLLAGTSDGRFKCTEYEVYYLSP